MVDDQGGSAWSHLDGSALNGPQAGEQLEVLALQTTTWGAWLEEHPDSTTVDIDTGYQNQYGEVGLGNAGLRGGFLATLDEIDPRLPESELVIGVIAGDGAEAFPIERAALSSPMQDEVGGVPVVVLEDSQGIPSLAYHRLLSDGRVLDFERRGDAIYDVQTGSRWTSSGLAVEGDLAGVQLAFVTSFFTEWYGWAAFHPDSTIFGEAA